MNIIKKLLRLQRGQLLMIPEAILLTGLYRYNILHRPFSELSPKIGSFGEESPYSTEITPTVMDVRKMVNAVSNRMPWTCNCMVRALTMKHMLARRGFPSTLYMGVAPTENGSMEAHAWLRCGTKYISGESEMSRFTVTGTFGA